jgi:hypothetical protein
MYEALHQRTINRHHWRDKFSVWYKKKKTKKKKQISPQSTLDRDVVFWLLLWWWESTWERCPSWVDWLDGLSETCWRIPCISCMWCLVQSARLSLHSNIFCGLLHMHVGLILIFSSRPCVKLYLCSLMYTSKVCLFCWCNICVILAHVDGLCCAWLVWLVQMSEDGD